MRTRIAPAEPGRAASPVCGTFGFGAGSDRLGPCAGEAWICSAHGFGGPTSIGSRCRSRTLTIAAADGGVGDPQAHVQSTGRGAVRTLGRKPPLSIVLWRGVLSSRRSLRPLLNDALASAHGRRQDRRAHSGKPEYRHARWRAAKPSDFTSIIVDTTMQPRAVAFPTNAKLMHRAREKLARLAKKHGVVLRQSYERVGKHALIAHRRYAHAKHVRHANRAPKTLRTYLGRVMRDIRRKIAGDPDRQAAFAQLLSLAHAARHRQQR